MTDRIEFSRMDIYDLLHDDRTFDVVLFLGVFYHLRYPLLALDMLVPKVKQWMLFQTMLLPSAVEFETPYDLDFDDRAMLESPGWPSMAFIEQRFAGDPTNWWVASRSGIEAMLRSSGFTVEKEICREFYLCKPAQPSPWAAKTLDNLRT